jgi:phosphoglucosamine mutase
MGTLFGTDGVRGVANMHPMTAEMALAIGRATAHICKRGKARHRIVIGKDTRISGYMIETALTAGICSMGVDVFLVGPMPTPGIACITHSMRADAGIVISASHNPYQDNGIKIFSREGFKFSDKMEQEIESLISTGKINDIRPTADAVGKATRIDDAIGRYIVFCKNTFPSDLTLDGMKIVLDCANGATYKVAPIIFSELGAEVIAIHNKPDGKNINHQCGSQHPEDLIRTVRAEKADAGLAFDGDGDRLIAVDEAGRELTGDHILAVCAKAMKSQGVLTKNLVVITPMANMGLRLAFDDMKIRYKEADVGDRHVLELMQKHGAVLGGEQSGHMILLNSHTTGDGIVSALALLAVRQRTGLKLSQLSKVMQVYPQTLLNIPVQDKVPFEEVPAIVAVIKAAEAKLEKTGKGRVLVRYSGTQPLCRVMVEAATEKLTNDWARTIADTIRKELA